MADVFETTDYRVRGDTHSNGSTNPLAAQFSALANGVGTGDQTPTDSELLLTCVNGAWYVKAFSKLWDYIDSKLSSNTPSHIGQIIHSTKLATLEDVQAIYGSNTTWIQHSGYILRGASSDVTADNAVKDGGEDTHRLTAAESGLPAHGHGFTQPTVNGGGIANGIGGGGHSHSLSNNTNVWRNDGGSNNIASGSSTRRAQITISLSGDGSHTHTLPDHTHSVSGGAVQNHAGAAASSAHNIMQSYKNVYIWERVS